jgi:type I restriction enzyme S subunit
MISAYGHTKYEQTKPSRAEWLGDVPAAWDIKKMKYLFRDHSQKGEPDATLLSVTQGQGVVPRTWVENRMVMPSGNLESFKFIEKDDFAISLRSFEGGLEYCHHDGIISPAYTVLKRRHADLDSGFYRHLFKSYAFISELQTSVVGIREGKNISFEELSYSLMPIPPLSEQRAVAAFLDDKCAKIDEAVKIKEDQIALLRERRQIIIQDAVTRGLNPCASMKDSGIDLIGQIPEHWDVKRAKFLFREINDRSQDGAEELLSVSHTTGVTSRSEKNINMFMADDYTGSKLCRPGDLVFNTMWAWMGALGVSNVSGIVSPSYGVYRQIKKDTFNRKYLEWLLRCSSYIEHYNKVSTGLHSSRLRFYAHMFFDMFLGFPSKAEQDEIVAQVEINAAQIEAGIAIKERQIAALKEYKSSLINAAVTGKIKVI